MREIRLVCIGLLLAVLTACGGTNGSELTVTPGGTQSMTEALRELEQLPIPDGISASDWQQLKGALATMLRASGKSRFVSAVAPPQKSAVTDFSVAGDTTSATFSWSYKNEADYDQNGEVNVADLTPLGVSLGSTSASPDWASAQLADGDSNGEVNISDITPIGASFKNSVNGYKLQYSSDGAEDGTWTDLEDVPTASGIVPGSGGAKTFSHVLAGGAEGWYRVTTFSGEETGAVSNSVQLVGTDPSPGVWSQTGGSPEHNHQSRIDGPATLGAVGIDYVFEKYQSARFASSGLAVCGTPYDKIVALDSGGAVTWEYFSGSAVSSLEVTSTDRVFGISERGRLFELDLAGQEQWANETGQLGARIEVFPDGRVVTLDVDGAVRGYASGAEQWTYESVDYPFKEIAAAPNGSTYILKWREEAFLDYRNQQVIALDAEGQELWTEDQPDDNVELHSLAAGIDSRAIFQGGELFALNPLDGSIDWQASGSFGAGPVVAPDGRIAIGGGGQPVDFLNVYDQDGGFIDNYSWGGGDVLHNLVWGLDGSLYWSEFAAGRCGHHPDGTRWSLSGTELEHFSEFIAGDLDGNVLGGGAGTLHRLAFDGSEVWTRGDTSGGIGQPVFAADGTAYTLSSNSLLAWAPSGGLKWSYPISTPRAGSPALGADGAIYCCGASFDPVASTYNSFLYAVNSDGSERWTIDRGEVTGLPQSKPTVTSFGVFIAGKEQDGSGFVRGYDLDSGDEIFTVTGTPWQAFNAEVSIFDPPVGEPVIYVAAHPDGVLYAYAQDGSENWAYPLTAGAGQTLVGPDGAVFVRGAELEAVEPDGTQRWHTNPGGGSGLALAPDGSLLCSVYPDGIRAIKPNGTEKWTYAAPGANFQQPVVDASGRLYSYTSIPEKKVVCLASDGDELWQYRLLDGGSPVIGPGGKLYLYVNCSLVSIAP